MINIMPRLKYKNKYKYYPDRYEVPNTAKVIKNIGRVHISSLKTKGRYLHMNKRIYKKNDAVRINEMLIEAIVLIDEYRLVYARLVGRKNYLTTNDDFWNEYDRWHKSNSGRRTWNYILKRNNLPKYIGYKNKIIKA
jgi:hypothetical protein